MFKTENINIIGIDPLVSPERLKSDFPITESCGRLVVESRDVIRNIIRKKDKRILAIAGPCSIHDTKAALEYAERLNALRKKIEDRIYVVMRVYFEKPRTTVGWKGLIVDPYLDGSYDLQEGLRIARKLLLDITAMGLPAGSEMLDPIVPQYISDLISWSAIGARTTESQTHRQLASGLSMPVGFKNGTDGSLQTAVDAMSACIHPQSFIGIDQTGQTCICKTKGNPDCHIILRGGRLGPNYYEEVVEEAERLMEKEKLEPAIVIDASHMNSGKIHSKQERVLKALAEHRSRGRSSVIGFMIESFLNEGSQKIPADLTQLKYGVSVTDECSGWEKTEEMMLELYNSLS